jgi:hypothetical protein
MQHKKIVQFAVGALMSLDIGIVAAQDKVSAGVVKIGVPAAAATQPLSASTCPLVKK